MIVSHVIPAYIDILVIPEPPPLIALYSFDSFSSFLINFEKNFHYFLFSFPPFGTAPFATIRLIESDLLGCQKAFNYQSLMTEDNCFNTGSTEYKTGQWLTPVYRCSYRRSSIYISHFT